MSTEQIAQVAHEVNRAYCEAIGDYSQVCWQDAPEWQRRSAIVGVQGIISGTIKGPGDSHASWLHQKQQDGWVFGEVKDVDTKTHPCMVSFDELPKEQQVKDYLFFAVVVGMCRL